MKKYIGTKQAEAEVMTLDEADKRMLVSAGSRLSKDEKDIEGYHVKYENGVETWLPKEEFEKTYKCSETFIDRLYVELEELQDKQNKLQKFFDTEIFKNLPKQKRTLLEAQFGAMLAYSSILIERIRVEHIGMQAES